MISILIPAGDFPFFIQAVYHNIRNSEDLFRSEIVFLTNKMTPRMRKAFDGLNGDFKVYTKEFPDQHGVHLSLLDWAVSELTLQPWVYVQHLDMFWLAPGWLDTMIANLHPGLIALVVPKNRSLGGFDFKEFKFILDGKPIPRTHDYAGLYNVAALREEKLSFQMGKIGHGSSDRLFKAINDKRIRWHWRDEVMGVGDEIDGSDRIGLEIAVRFPDRIAELSCINVRYTHCGDMFGFLFQMQREGDTISISRNLQKCMRGLPTYSWVSSFLFDKDEMADLIFPWSVFKKIRPIAQKDRLCNFLEIYKNTSNVLGEGEVDIRKVRFLDQQFNL